MAKAIAGRMSFRSFCFGLLLLPVLLAGGCGRQSNENDASRLATQSPATGISTSTAGVEPPASAGDGFQGRTIKIDVAGKRVTPTPGTVDVKLGERVRLQVTADTQDEVHVHAYDEKAPVAAGRPAYLEFVADIPGSFEVELEKSKTKLVEIRVR